jgi:CRP-like cAMP-binding protein
MDTTTAELNPLSNRLLAGLPRDSFQLLAPHLTVTRFALGAVLAETGDEVDQVIFPLSGMISLVVVMKDGRAIETATIGRDGVYGEAVAFGPYRSKVRALVQMEMNGAWLTSQQFRKAGGASPALQAMCFEHNEALLAQARITAACNALHLVEARFCRWLLQTRAVTESDTLTLTQEFLSEMLGVRRTSVTEVASRLQAKGIISYSRGVIRIVDLPALEERACECLQTLREQRAL